MFEINDSSPGNYENEFPPDGDLTGFDAPRDSIDGIPDSQIIPYADTDEAGGGLDQWSTPGLEDMGEFGGETMPIMEEGSMPFGRERSDHREGFDDQGYEYRRGTEFVGTGAHAGIEAQEGEARQAAAYVQRDTIGVGMTARNTDGSRVGYIAHIDNKELSDQPGAIGEELARHAADADDCRVVILAPGSYAKQQDGTWSMQPWERTSAHVYADAVRAALGDDVSVEVAAFASYHPDVPDSEPSDNSNWSSFRDDKLLVELRADGVNAIMASGRVFGIPPQA